MLRLFAGLLLIIFAPFWLIAISPELLVLPPNYSSIAGMVHDENNRFVIGSNWSGKAISLSSSEIKTFKTLGDQASLQSLFRVESLTGDTLFELDQNFLIDRETRHNLPGGNDVSGKSMILFRPNTSRSNQNYWPIEMGSPSVLNYVGNKTIQSLNTYHFQTVNSVINDTIGYEFLPLVPEKYQVNSRVNMDIYVEPVTGIVIDHEDSGVSSYVDKDGKTIWDIAQWSNKYNEPTINMRVAQARSQKQTYLLISRIIPGAIFLLGFALAISGVGKSKISTKRRSNSKAR